GGTVPPDPRGLLPGGTVPPDPRGLLPGGTVPPDPRGLRRPDDHGPAASRGRRARRDRGYGRRAPQAPPAAPQLAADHLPGLAAVLADGAAAAVLRHLPVPADGRERHRVPHLPAGRPAVRHPVGGLLLLRPGGARPHVLARVLQHA